MTGETTAAAQIVLRFNDALNARDLDGMMALMAPDVVFENTFPPPDGARFEGQAAVRAFWEQFFQGSTEATIEPEELFTAGNRCIMRWVYRWVDAAGTPGHVRGVDLYTIAGGLIAAKLSYVKG